MKNITKREVSNMVFGADMAYGRIIEFQTELDTQGTDENLKGVMSPSLSWAKKGDWRKLPEGLRKFEEERAAKAMGINTRISEEMMRAIQADLDEKRNEIVAACIDEDASDEEMSERLAEFNALNTGIFLDFEDDVGEAIHPNWVTFVQGEEEEVITEEKPEKADRVKAKIEKRNWLHLKSFEGNRNEMVEWFISKQDAICSSARCSITRERALKRAEKLNELLDKKRDESFDQRLLDSIEPPPYREFPQFRRREHYLNAGGRKGKDVQITKMLEQVDGVRRMTARTPEQKEQKRQAYETLFETYSGDKWFQLYMVFVESRKLGTEQYLMLKRRNDALIEAIEGGLSYIPSAPEKSIAAHVDEEEITNIDRVVTIAAHVRLLMKLNYLRELYKEAVDACDDDMRIFAYERGIRHRKLVEMNAANINLTKDESNLINLVMES